MRRDYPQLTPEAAAEYIDNGATIAFSGFTPAGAAKAVPEAVAARAMRLHAAGEKFKIRVLTGASTGKHLDEPLAMAEAISWRAPYQSSTTLRGQINSGAVEFVDMHLSHVPQALMEGFLGPVAVAVVEASDVTPDGRVYLTSSIGVTPTFLKVAEKVIIERNAFHPPRVSEMADIVVLSSPPHRSPIPIYAPLDKIGWPYVSIDPGKILGIVETNEPDDVLPFSAPDPVSVKIGENVVRFLLGELAADRIPPQMLPLQAGVGNISNAVMAQLGENMDFPKFIMFTEVFQDANVELMERGRLVGASSSGLALSPPMLKRVYENLDFFAPRIVLRPAEISNNPAVIRGLGVISINTALEIDIYGHVNSTHVCGQSMMNGIGGSGDFTRNAYLSIFMCPSYAKGGRISSIVPMCTHVDHNEHSVQAVITEQGIADCRGVTPVERARRIINNCAHPAYRDYLNRYLERSSSGHIRHDLGTCFDLHRNLMECGQMLPDLKLEGFAAR